MAARNREEESALSARVRVPEHVVYRDFPDETVILNLETGMYHGLNPTASRMLEALRQSDSIRTAVSGLAKDFEQPEDVIRRDVLSLCEQLAERGLIVRDAAAE